MTYPPLTFEGRIRLLGLDKSDDYHGDAIVLPTAGFYKFAIIRGSIFIGNTTRHIIGSFIVPTFHVGMRPEPLCGSGRRSIPQWVPTQSVGTIRINKPPDKLSYLALV